VNASTGALTANRTYTVFGQPEQPVADPVGFGGQVGYYTDAETGFVLCTARYYDPTLGRWLTRDPIGYDGGIDVYAFCDNNPEMEVDPSGNGGSSIWDWFSNTTVGKALLSPWQCKLQAGTPTLGANAAKQSEATSLTAGADDPDAWVLNLGPTNAQANCDRVSQAGAGVVRVNTEIAGIAATSVVGEGFGAAGEARAAEEVLGQENGLRWTASQFDHAFDKHAYQWYGMTKDAMDAAKPQYVDQWLELMQKVYSSNDVIPYRLGTPKSPMTEAHLAFVDGKYVALFVYTEGKQAGQFASMFRPNARQVAYFMRYLGKR
jgi:RHS repeat-associated protein